MSISLCVPVPVCVCVCVCVLTARSVLPVFAHKNVFREIESLTQHSHLQGHPGKHSTPTAPHKSNISFGRAVIPNQSKFTKRFLTDCHPWVSCLGKGEVQFLLVTSASSCDHAPGSLAARQHAAPRFVTVTSDALYVLRRKTQGWDCVTDFVCVRVCVCACVRVCVCSSMRITLKRSNSPVTIITFTRHQNDTMTPPSTKHKTTHIKTKTKSTRKSIISHPKLVVRAPRPFAHQLSHGVHCGVVVTIRLAVTPVVNSACAMPPPHLTLKRQLRHGHGQGG